MFGFSGKSQHKGPRSGISKKVVNTFHLPPMRGVKSRDEDGVEKLKIFPGMGLPVHLAPDPEIIRDLYIGQYTIRYLLSKKRVYILRIWHGKEIEKDL